MPADRSQASTSAGPAKRISKACESCRPRTHRPLPGTSNAAADEVRLVGLRAVEEDLEARYKEATGTSISLALPDVETHPALSLDSPMPPLPTLTNDEIDSLCDTFFRDILIFFGFLSPTRLNELIRRHRTLPGTLTPDQLALLYAIFALGFFRQATYAQQPAAPEDGPVPFAPGANRLDIVYYRQGMALLEVPTTLTALQALVVLQLYAMSSTTVSATRHLISKMVYCAGELGLYSTATSAAYPPETHATSLSFYVLFTDTFYAGLTGDRPFLRAFDREIFTSVLRSEGIFSPAMVRLVCLEHDYLKDAHAHRTKLCNPLFVLGHEAHLFAFLRDFGTQTGDSTNMSSSFATTQCAHSMLQFEHHVNHPILISYQFQRLLLRAPCASDPLLGHSSLPLLSRAAITLIRHYQSIFESTRYINCAWPVLARVVAAGNVVLQSHWRGELVRQETEDALSILMWLLGKLETRWTAATVARANFELIMQVLDLNPHDLPSPAYLDSTLSENPSSTPLLPATLPPPPTTSAQLSTPDAPAIFDNSQIPPSATSSAADYSIFFSSADASIPANATQQGEWQYMLNEMHELWGDPAYLQGAGQ
ncbi:C6 transcription factor [Rhodotorula toruloides]|uniref:C6 transcription factor n=1 Tax=Rhodotorula toruloides TaxID=5286 RepID=A0A511KI26_RHOTO|nr:C6 transcription factor [Rhodotorula toruloides]